MQSISGNEDSTHTFYMGPLIAGKLSLPCWPCLGPCQLKFGDYQLVVAILGGGSLGCVLSGRASFGYSTLASEEKASEK